MPKQVSINGATEGLITQQELGNIIARYKTERIQALPSNLGDDSTSVWISKDKLTEFFAKNANATGIRFYFGVVDDPYVPHGVHNLLLIPTVDRQQDQVSDTDWIIITQNSGETTLESFIAANGGLDALICPPPVTHCNGRIYP